MDVSDKEKLETEKTGDDSITYHHTPEMFSSDWQYNARPNFVTSSSRGLTADGNNVGPSSSPAVSIADSFVPSTWDHHLPISQSVGYNGLILQNIANSSSDYLSLARGGFSLESSGWDASVKGEGFLANISTTILPHSISPFPADSAFIERAARFSCFNAENVGEMVNQFGINQSVVNLCSNQEAFAAVHAVKLASDGQPPKNEINDVALISQTAPLMGEEGDKVDSERKNERFSAEAKQDDSDEAEAGGGGEEEPFFMNTSPVPGPSSSRKRKRSDEDTETKEQSQQQVGEDGGKESGSKSSPPVTNKNSGKNAKRTAQTSEQPEDYIHVRARRGQATNSHSLAERVRREKISERMKFLQDLVPGCSKVTGKAVMLDEIINYVQSLQRQVEFLSMKLATVNPRLDFNIESLLAKDPMHGARAGPSMMGFTPDISMAYHMMHPPQQSFSQPNLAPPVTSSSDALRNITSQLTGIGAGYKEPLSQLPNMWDDELHNVVQMGFNPTASGTGTSNDEDTKGPLPAAGQMKVEI